MASSSSSACIFCKVARGGSGRQVLMRSDRCIAFASSRPAAAAHHLVIPREHRGSVRSLGAGDRGLLEEMREMGKKLMMADHAGLGDADAAKWRFVFHVPPFNSIEHLHLHCLKPPFANRWKDLTFTPGWPWCVSMEGLLDRLK